MKGINVMKMKNPGRAHIIPNVYDITTEQDAQKWASSLPDMVYIKLQGGKVQKYVADVTCSFDIENTTIEDNGEYYGYMYVWQMNFGDDVLIGRTWKAFKWILSAIANRFPELGRVQKGTGKHRITCYHYIIMGIANESYEFQYLAQQHTEDGTQLVGEIFADETRRPITTWLNLTCGNIMGILCVDVLRIGSLSLKALGEDFCTTRKLKGDLDYSKMRNSKTPLTDKEKAYCINDAVVVGEYMRYYLDGFVKQCKLQPITKTGIVRSAVARSYTDAGMSPLLIQSYYPDTFAEYSKIFLHLYRGGYTHANIHLAGIILKMVSGFDYTSSYPAVILQENFYPLEPFKKTQAPKRINDLDDYAEKHNKCWYATFRFKNITALTQHSVESLVKVLDYREKYNCNEQNTRIGCGITEDNGRVLAAREITVMLNEQDWKTYRKFYTWEEIEIADFHISEAGAIPDYIQTVVKHFYKIKSALKKQGKDGEPDYIMAKQMVNAIYGLCCQRVHLSNIEYSTENGVWNKAKPDEDIDTAYQKAVGKNQYAYDKWGNVKKPKFWMNPFFGIWITAHARRRILEAIYAMGNDAIYADTDSVYVRNPDKHMDYFKAWNENIINLNKKLFGNDFDLLGDLGTFDPVAIKYKNEDGTKGKATRYDFKTWGSKRYVKMDNQGHMEQTIAGLPKDTLIKAVMKKNPSMTEQEAAFACFDFFEPEMVLDLDDSMKLTTSYHDKHHQHLVIDEFGNAEMMGEESSVCLYKIPFEMHVKDYYLAMMQALQETKREWIWADDLNAKFD